MQQDKVTTDIQQRLWVEVYLKYCGDTPLSIAENKANAAVDAFNNKFEKDEINQTIEYPILTDLKVSVRVYNCLLNATHYWAKEIAEKNGRKDDMDYRLGIRKQIKTLKDFTDNISKEDLMRERNMGKHSMDQFVSVCKKYGINYE